MVKEPNILIASRATTTHAFCNHTETNISITDAVQYDESLNLLDVDDEKQSDLQTEEIFYSIHTHIQIVYLI